MYAKGEKEKGGGGRKEGERDIRGPKNVRLMLLMVSPLTRGQPLVLEPLVEQPIVTLSYGERERERERGREGGMEREREGGMEREREGGMERERESQRLRACIDEERCLSPYRHLLLLIS